METAIEIIALWEKDLADKILLNLDNIFNVCKYIESKFKNVVGELW